MFAGPTRQRVRDMCQIVVDNRSKLSTRGSADNRWQRNMRWQRNNGDREPLCLRGSACATESQIVRLPLPTATATATATAYSPLRTATRLLAAS